MMGPLRTAWTFPYSGKELLARCDAHITELADRIDKTIDEEQEWEREVGEYREALRTAGVKNWEAAMPEQGATRQRYSTLRSRQTELSRKLREVERFRRQLAHDLERDEFRLYKLTIDDVIYFGL